MNRTQLDALDAAIQEDHPCSDTIGCDIAVAQANGFTVAAALLLEGATETPHLNRVCREKRIALGNLHSPAFNRWVAWHRKHGKQCPACESYMYADLPVRCTNCLHMITAEEATEEECTS